MSDSAVDIRLIPEFDGASQGVSEWLEKVELVCELRGVVNKHQIVPLRLTGGAFAVYQQLSAEDNKSYDKVKKALLSAFATDQFCASEQFIARTLKDGESVDVYLADLRRLAALFGGIPDPGLACVFVAGLPEEARRTLRGSSRIESMDIVQILCRARAVLVEETGGAAAVAGVRSPRSDNNVTEVSAVTCHICGLHNHYARDCLARRGGRRGGRTNLRCFRCGRRGHISSSCSENFEGETVSAPASSPSHQ